MHYVSSKILVKCCLALGIGVSLLLSCGVTMHAVAQEVEVQPQPKNCRPYDFGPVGSHSGSYEGFAGKNIVKIDFLNIEVFNPDNPKENNALYQFLNKLHVSTKQNVVSAQLLFAQGQPLDEELVAETERILRALPYLSFAAIHLSQECAEGVGLLVVTRDVWTTEPIFNYSRQGGDTKRGFGFKEGNMLGTGSSVSLVFDKTAERSRTQYNYSSPHLFNTRFRVRVGFAENSDGQETAFAVGRPFYSLDSRWATGLSNIDTTSVEKIRFGDEQINAYKHERERHDVHFGLGFYTGSAHRVSLGISQDRDVYEATELTLLDTPLDSNFVYPWLQYHYLQNKFGVYKNLDLLHRVEDIPLGVDFAVRLGYGGEVFGNDVDVFYLDSHYEDVVGIGDHHIMKLATLLRGYVSPEASEYNHSVWGGSLKYYFLRGDLYRYFAQVQYHQGHKLLQHEQLTTGGENGLRGYPLDYQRGEKRLLVSVENRYITPWHIFNLVRVGAVVFMDAGRAWGGGYNKTKTLANVGVGIRLSSSKAKLDHIVHLDLAFPLVDKSEVEEYQMVMKVESHF